MATGGPMPAARERKVAAEGIVHNALTVNVIIILILIEPQLETGGRERDPGDRLKKKLERLERCE